ncbi:hypothetical protein AQJ58_25735 [Streptomyces sp. DSM 15324]|nr:hypothetical protein AQJ58_25735 [Streptomyces sp. DSM 15324]
MDATAAQEPDGWLQVTDWNPVGLLPAGTVADKSLLDSLNTRRPIYLQGSDFHNSLANTRALALAGVDRTTPDPPGGKIVRGADGEPTGRLTDDAQGLVSQVTPPPSPDLVLAAQKKMAGALLAAGITSIPERGSGRGRVHTSHPGRVGAGSGRWLRARPGGLGRRCSASVSKGRVRPLRSGGSELGEGEPGGPCLGRGRVRITRPGHHMIEPHGSPERASAARLPVDCRFPHSALPVTMCHLPQ